jgi:hypothetical protein
MTNGSVRPHSRHVNSRHPGAWAPLAAAWALGAALAAFAQESQLEVTLQVLDDVSAIEGVLMPLEEVPAHSPDTEADSAR